MGRRVGRCLTAVIVLAVVVWSGAVMSASAKTGRNYGNDWSAIGAGSFSWSRFSSVNVYSALQLESLCLVGSHAAPGNMVFRNNGSWTCIGSYTWALPHKHSVGGYESPCEGAFNIRSITSDSPCLIVMWQGCDSYLDPDGSGSKHIYMDDWGTDFSTGYWKSLAEGNYANAAMDAGVSYVRWRHLGASGRYEYHDYDGGNPKI